MAFIESDVSEAGEMRRLGWADDDDVSSAGHHLADGRRQESPFRDRGLWLQDFGQGVARPPGAGEFRVQCRESA